MKIGQIVKTSDNQCKASIVQIKGDRVRIKMTWKSGLSYISDFHQYSWYDKSFIAPLLETDTNEWQRTSIDDILYHSETDRFAFFNPLTNEIDAIGFLDDCKLASALFFFRCEKELCIDEFNADLCLEDIHRIYGIDTCNAVKQSLSL